MQNANPFHTPEEMRAISNLAHVIEGAVLGAAACLALLHGSGLFRRDWIRYAWPTLVVVAGVFLMGYLLIPHHGLDTATTQWRYIFADAQQRQHVMISLLILLGGLSELIAVRGTRGLAWRLGWPVTLAAVGMLLVLHPQHGTSAAMVRATMQHRLIGTALLAAGALAAVSALRPSRVLGALSPLALVAAAIMLVAYREPVGAFHAHP